MQRKLAIRTAIYLGLAVIAGLYILMCVNGYGFPCLFNEWWGIECISCGASRAFFALMRLDIVAASHYNALFTFVIYPAAAYLCIQDYLYAVLSVIMKRQFVSVIDMFIATGPSLKRANVDKP